ncbi:MAG: hypothetical protein ACAH83_07520 [Alphaproteobacteria bacterium]
MQQVFMMPSGQAKEAFNTTAFIKGAATPNYLTDDKSNLADIQTTLAALAVPGIGNYNRSALYPRDIADVLANPPKTDAERIAFRIITGTSKIDGWGFVVLQVAGQDGKPVNLYALEDQRTSRMVVVGPSAIDEDFRAVLAKNGVFYVSRTAENAATQVNNFVGEGAAWRARNEEGDYYSTVYVMEKLMQAMLTTCPLPFLGDEESHRLRIVPKNSTVGKLLTAMGEEEASVYTRIQKPKPSFFANLPP